MPEVSALSATPTLAHLAYTGRRDVPSSPAQTQPAPIRRGEDAVTLSVTAAMLSKLRENPVREDLIASVREQIASGTYDTPEKMDAAMDELLGDITA